MTQRASIALSRYDWPGNVRELENAMGHACMMVLSDTIVIAELPEYLRSPERSQNSRDSRGDASSSPPADSLPQIPDPGTPASMLERTERRLISDALAKSSGNHQKLPVFRALGEMLCGTR